MRLARALVASFVISGSLGACSLVTSFSDLTGSAVDASVGDDAPSFDATPTSDVAPAIVDAGIDAFCTQDGARFCDDFENRADGDVQGGWSSVSIKLGALGLKAGNHDGGTGLFATVQSTGARNAYLLRDFIDPMTDGRVSFDLYAEAISSGVSYAVTLQFPGTSSTIGREVQYAFFPGVNELQNQVELIDGGTFETRSAAFASVLTPGVWHHVDLYVSFGANPSTSIVVDGQQEVADASLYSDFVPAVPKVGAGIVYTSSTAPSITLAIDNVEVVY